MKPKKQINCNWIGDTFFEFYDTVNSNLWLKILMPFRQEKYVQSREMSMEALKNKGSTEK